METRELLLDAEAQAERTTALLRLAIAAILGLIFYFAVMRSAGFASTPIVQIVPYVWLTVGSYTVVSAASFVLSRRDRFRPWMPWVFTTCDVVFFTVNVGGAIHQIGIPASYMSIVPAVWVAPLVLAMVVLRYNPFLQAYSGALVAVSLVCLIEISAADAGSDGPVIGHFDALIAGSPNAMRIAMVALTAILLVAAAAGARRLLTRGIEETVRRGNLTRYLPAQIADRLAETGVEAMRAGRQQDAAVLFADIRGFTERSEGMDPAALSRFVTRFRGLAVAAADASDGVVDKFIGDCAMIVFGVPEPRRRDARNALDCAARILEALAAWNAERQRDDESGVRIGVGIHFGPVFCGAVGDENRLEFTVLGDTVNVAARLEEETKRAGFAVVVSEELLQAAGVAPGDDWTALTTGTVRGRHGELRLFGRGTVGPATG